MDSDKMGKIPANMVKVDDRKLIQQGSSTVVSIPTSILKEAGVGRGDVVSLYNNGKGQLLVDLTPEG